MNGDEREKRLSVADSLIGGGLRTPRSGHLLCHLPALSSPFFYFYYYYYYLYFFFFRHHQKTLSSFKKYTGKVNSLHTDWPIWQQPRRNSLLVCRALIWSSPTNTLCSLYCPQTHTKKKKMRVCFFFWSFFQSGYPLVLFTVWKISGRSPPLDTRSLCGNPRDASQHPPSSALFSLSLSLVLWFWFFSLFLFFPIWPPNTMKSNERKGRKEKIV